MFVPHPDHEIYFIPTKESHVRTRIQSQIFQNAIQRQIPAIYGDEYQYESLHLIGNSGTALKVWRNEPPKWYGTPYTLKTYIRRCLAAKTRRFCYYRRVLHGEIFSELEKLKSEAPIKPLKYTLDFHIAMDDQERFYVLATMLSKSKEIEAETPVTLENQEEIKEYTA